MESDGQQRSGRIAAEKTGRDRPMKREAWRRRIRKACQEAGTYRPYFENIIFSLAEILEARDQVRKYYEDSGALPIVQRTNKGGHTNIEENPILVTYNNYNKTAMLYWKELGLTPRGLKAIDEKSMSTQQKKASHGDALREIGI